MATSGSGTTGAKQNRSLTFAWERTGTNYTKNTSTISWTLKGSGSASGYVKGGGLYVKINGSVKVDESTDTRYELRNGTTYKSGSATITHNNDGTKTFNVVVKAGIYEYARNVSLDTNFTLTALTRTVSYNGNGNTGGSTSSQTKTFGTALALRSNGFTKTGYHFTKWNTAANGTGTSYNAGASFTSEVASTTLYAQWAIDTYSVTYNANNGTGAPAAQTKTYGTNLTLSSTKPTRTGYTFKNWNTKADGTGTTYNAGATYTSNAALTLYAQWTINTWTVTLNANNGKFNDETTTKNLTKTYGTALTLSTSYNPTRTNYVFKGWGTSASATSATYAAGDNYTTNAATTLYAVWQLNAWNVTYNANGGTGAPANGLKIANETYTIGAAPTRNGYSFKGWGTSSTATTASYQPGDSYTTNAALSLYALWTPWSHTVSYNGNGGTGVPSSQTSTTGSSITIPATSPAKSGYTFKCWNTKADGTGINYYPGDTYNAIVANGSTVTLYALWVSNNFYIRNNGVVNTRLFIEKR